MIDSTDRALLAHLQAGARMSNAELARRVGLVPSATHQRVRKLEQDGTIDRYETRLSPQALGLHLLAFVFVKTAGGMGDQTTGRRLADIPEVQEVHNIAGEDCFLIKVRARDPQALGELLRERLGAIETVAGTRSAIVLDTLKETSALPLPAEA